MCILVLAALGLHACARYADEHVARGDAYFAGRRYREAVDEYDKTVRLRPDDPHSIRQLGLAHQALGDRKDAYAFLEKARDLNGADTIVRVSLGNMYLADGHPDSALREASAALQVAPKSLGALNLLGAAYLAKKDGAKAEDTFRKIVKLRPGDPRAFELVGMALLAQGRTAEARQAFEAVLSGSPSFTDALTQLVGIDLVANRPDAAVARVRKQIALVGDSAGLHNLIGEVYLYRGDPAAAAVEFRTATQLDHRDVGAYERLSELSTATGKYGQALAIADSGLTVDSGNVRLRFDAGVAYERMGDRTHARQSYEQALAVNPRLAPAANNLARLLAENNADLARAFYLAQTAAASAPDDPQISDTLGWILYKRGDYARSVATLEQAAAKLANNPAVLYHLGMARAKAGDVGGARASLGRALDSPANFPERSAAQKALASLR